MQKEIRDMIRNFVSMEIEDKTNETGTSIKKISNLSLENFTEINNEKSYLKNLLEEIKHSGFEVEEKIVIKEITKLYNQIEDMLVKYGEEIQGAARCDCECVIEYQKDQGDFYEQIEDLDYIDEYQLESVQDAIMDFKSRMESNLLDDYVLDNDFNGGVDHDLYEINQYNKHADIVIRKLIGIYTLEEIINAADTVYDNCEEMINDIKQTDKDIEVSIEYYTKLYTSNVETKLNEGVEENNAKEIEEFELILNGIKEDLIAEFNQLDSDDMNIYSILDDYKTEETMVYEIKEAVEKNVNDYFNEFIENELPVLIEKNRIKKQLLNF